MGGSYERTPDIFSQDTIRAAREVILCGTHGRDTDERWQEETPVFVDLLTNYIRDGDTVLDYGAGIGRLTIPLAQRFQSSRFYAADASDSMRHFGRQRLFDADPSLQERVRFIPGAPLETIAGGSVDLAFSVYVLQHIDAPRFPQVVREIRRVLKPEGKLYVFNCKRRAVVDLTKPASELPWDDDGFDQYGALADVFGPPLEVPIAAPALQPDLKDHLSLLYGKP